MKKMKLFSVLLLSVFSFGLTSCGDDDDPPVDPDYNKTNLVGSYEGTCQVKTGTTDKTFSSFPGTFSPDATNTGILNATLGNSASFSDIGFYFSNIHASDFKDKGDYAAFKFQDINIAYEDENVPDFIKSQVQFQVKKVTVTISCADGAKFVKNSKVLTFVYKGSFKVEGTESGQSYSNNITYTFYLTKK